MKAYVLSVAGIVLIIAAISIISPNGKMGKFVKGIGKLFILVVMTAPFVSFFTKKGDTIFTNANIATDADYLSRCVEMLCEEDEREISAFLNDVYQMKGNVTVTRGESSGFPREMIEVKITDFGIIGQGGNINKTEDVRKALEERYGCKAVVS